MSIRWNKHLVILYDKSKGALVCDALQSAIGNAFPEFDVITVDDVGYVNSSNRFWRVKTSHFYAKNAQVFVKWYSRVCDTKDNNRIKAERPFITSSEPEKLSFSERRSAAIRRIVNIMKRFCPAIMVCTNTYALKLTLLARRILGMDTRIVAVVSDFALSSGFVRPGVDLYMVENESLKTGLMHYGVDREKIVISGMPFSESQRPENSRLEARNLLGVTSDLPLVVVNGGDYCTATIKDEVVRLMNEHGKYCMLVLTYDNASLRRAYRKIAEENEIEVLFKTEMEYSLIFAAADVIVTIPDTHFIFSAFVNKIPVVLLDGITILEHDVFHYLVSSALVTPAKNPEETYAAVEELLVDTDRRIEMVEREQGYYLREKMQNDNLLFNHISKLQYSPEALPTVEELKD